MRSLEIFGGCGGLALGLSRAGFTRKVLIERDGHAVQTLVYNQQRGVRHFCEWDVVEADVCGFAFDKLGTNLDLVSGGPPCQPFSIGGKHLGPADHRNLWPEAIRAVKETRPKAFIFENVQGLLRPAFQEYLRYIVLQLRWPSRTKPKSLSWQQHAIQLSSLDEASPDLREYQIDVKGINAADYGAAQKRHRAIVVGVRSDISSTCQIPNPTHSQASLTWDKYISGDYWIRHGIDPGKSAGPSATEARLVAQLRQLDERPNLGAWTTARDRLSSLGAPLDGGQDPNHYQRPGARRYRNHTGSLADEPAKALKAGAHGVPGGENMLVQSDNSVRYFTVREMARLQGFPDEFIATGSWRHVTRQLGNAVPAEIGEAIGSYIAGIIASAVSTRIAA
ncbi:MAG TPA: DNA cytosine methyltransferase [Allosphingosinicella sp.]